MVNNSNQTTNNHASGGGMGYSSLLSDQVYNQNGRTGGANPYNGGKSTYADKQNWDKAQIYKDAETGEVVVRKYKRFNDLKLLNEQMINLANNMQPDDSPLEVLSQGQKGEIKNLLIGRIFKISFLPAIAVLLLTLTLVLTDHLLVTLSTLMLYIFIMGRTFFYPAKLYYENIQYKTTTHAKVFFEEMDFWFKTSVVNTLVLFSITSFVSLIIIFFEENIINLVVSISKNMKGSTHDMLLDYASSISFTYSLSFAIILYISTILFYFKFINKEKEKNEIIKESRIKDIRNQTMSRVEQIQADKNEIH